MALCLFDPQAGYYMRRNPFGRAGDFVTAPEISQMFGELIGAWLVAAWRALGRPPHPAIVEIGPGRGTLMRDLQRTLRQLEPQLLGAPLHLVETSSGLAAVQRETLAGAEADVFWHDELGTVPEAPLLLVANELFDAVPIRQYVRAGETWRERCVGRDAAGALTFLAGAGSLDPALLPPGAAVAPDGAVAEIAPARSALMQQLAGRLAEAGGTALVIDYGYAEPALGDTLQAVRKHRRDGPLANPGLADLTAHVDFAALAAVARAHGLGAALLTQGQFLSRLGLKQRAERLAAAGDRGLAERLRGEVERLAGAGEMGELFKVLAIGPRGLALPGFG